MTRGDDALNPQGSATVMGTIHGQPVSAGYAMETQLTTTTNDVTVTSRTIGITSVATACPCTIAQEYPTVLVLTVGVVGAVLPTGVYSLPSSGDHPSGSNPVGGAHYLVNDPGTTLVSATSGTITVSQASSSTTVGSFDLVFPNGDHLTGTFSAPTCAAQAGDAAACP